MRWMPVVLFCMTALAGCQTDDGSKPGPAASATSESPANAAAPAKGAEALFEGGASEPIEFVKVQYNIPRGAQIGVSRGSMARCKGAGGYFDRKLYWSEPRRSAYDSEFEDAFYYAGKEAGLDVVGDPRTLFQDREDRSRATLAVAAEIVRFNIDLCDEVNWMDKRTGVYSGVSEVEVVWHVYDKLQRRVIHSESTNGRAVVKDMPDDSIKVFVTAAFEEAARALARSPQFREAVAKAEVGETSRTAPASSSLPTLDLTRSAALSGPFAQHADLARQATVTIDLGDGHGSGFVVDARGFVLTNEHVVGGRERVRVRFLDGSEVIGQVVRRDRLRDVALIRIAPGDRPALPIRAEPAAVAEEVHAVGAPLDPQLSNTVTKGVVSAIRRERNGLTYIQADVNIQSGNSGGPLLDGSGNVVGITVAGIRMEGVMAGINFFIPIHDALERLNLKLVERPGSTS